MTYKIMSRIQFILVLSMLQFTAWTQIYNDHLGNGHTLGVESSSSSEDTVNIAPNSIIGPQYFPDEAAAVRFLQQASFGYNYSDVQDLTSQGINSWIDEQIALDYTSLDAEAIEVQNHRMADDSHLEVFINYPWWTKVFTDEDQLRMKTAYALSQILVVSSALRNNPAIPIRDYFDVLYTHAFGNFRDILFDVSIHEYMGDYLSFNGNERQNLVEGTFPDENYAREIMQLFTIGLNELNNDGTLKLDANGNIIPTYDIEDITQLAKVFTGLTGIGNTGFRMLAIESKHDNSPKEMIDGSVIPSSQTAFEDINQALDVLFNHANTGPFLAIRLIQQFVKSNPTPAYVNRVATVFNDNGEGVRGDLAAVIKAVLLDPEARDCEWADHETAGKLLQYPELFTIVMKVMNMSTPSDLYYMEERFVWGGNQQFLRASSVFNYFSPFFAEPTTVEPAGLVSPEFSDLSPNEAIEYFNSMRDVLNGRPFENNTNFSNDDPSFDISFEENLYDTQGVSAVIDHYNLLLCRNQMPESTQLIIEDAITEFEDNVNGYDSDDAVRDIVLFIATTAYFTVLN